MARGAALGNRDRVLPEIGELQVLAQHAAVGVRIGAHATRALGCQLAKLGDQPAVGVEQFLGPVALEPSLEQLQTLGVGAHVGDRHLVRAPRTLGLVPLDLFRTGPALGRSQHDHRPARPVGALGRPRLVLDRANLGDRLVEGGGHFLVHLFGVIAFDEVGRVAVSPKQRLQFFVADAREDRGVGDLVAVQVEDRQHRAVADRVQELVRMPGRGERTGLGLSVAHDTGHDQLGIVERHAVGVRERIAELAALVDRARRFRSDVATDVAGEGKLLEELLQSLGVLALVGIDLRVRPFEVRRPQHAGRAMARSGDEDHVEVVSLDQAVEMRPDERQRRARAPVAEQAVFDVGDGQRLRKQRVLAQVDHADREVVARAPPSVHAAQLVDGEGRRLYSTGVHVSSGLYRSITRNSSTEAGPKSFW